MKLLKINTILHTKDGRQIGNAIVIGHHERFNIIKTDYGNELKLTTEEINEQFYIAYTNMSASDKKYMREIRGDHKYFIKK